MIKNNIRRDTRLDSVLNQRIDTAIEFNKTKGNKNYCFSKFAREAFKEKLEREEPYQI